MRRMGDISLGQPTYLNLFIYPDHSTSTITTQKLLDDPIEKFKITTNTTGGTSTHDHIRPRSDLLFLLDPVEKGNIGSYSFIDKRQQ